VAEAAFNPGAVADREIERRLKISGAALPAGWVAGRLPRPTLPIDESVQVLLRKKRIRDAVDLQAMHRFGSCPYAVARSGVVRAALCAGIQQIRQDQLKPRVVDALKYLKDEGPKLRAAVYWAEVRAECILGASEQLGVSIPSLKRLFEALSRSRRLLESTNDGIASLHHELSKYRGNVWRLTFVTALFAEWWILTNRDPVASPGPCQEFICAAWCSLSPHAAATDADWGSAIRVARSRCKPGEWRVGSSSSEPRTR
jgi:hypothetical protein